ncbi:MAG TPA: hydrogenase maturation protease [Symbiobacteriaceae bacterium]|nr:hydrogenase maturation protease [Symbiobacteriaceae bacterium]
MTVIIGLGNSLCADDGAGLEAVRQLVARGGLPPGVRVVEAGCPGLGLLDLMAGARRAILVDAVVSGAAPGTIHRFTLEALPPREMFPLSLHGVGAMDALELGRLAAADQLPGELVILGVEVADRTPFHRGLGPEVASALPELITAIWHELDPQA